MNGIGSTSVRQILGFLFAEFGIHCATHQIRVILISCVVITSLLYPALAIYASSRPFSRFSSPLLNLLPLDNVRSSHISDLHDIWQGYEALKVRQDAAARARCGFERTVRVERLLVASYMRDGVLNKPLLKKTLSLERDIAAQLIRKRDQLPCVVTPHGLCFSTSPLMFWDHDDDTLMNDPDILETMNHVRNDTLSKIPIHLPMVLAGRMSLSDSDKTDYGAYLVLTYYFRENDCQTMAGHDVWKALASEAVMGKGHARFPPAQPRLLALQFDSHLANLTIVSTMLYLMYIVVFIHFSGTLRKMDSVHSRYGLAFTGLIEIIASTVCSVSVCAIWGFRVTMVPWGFLPITVVFIGAENMFRLVDEVVSTSITLPVKERISKGMGVAGASNTLKVVTCNAVLGIIAVFARGAIRQFCVFAVVVLVAHWFLVHTFFVAVLSIDLQRLELHDLIRQDKSLKPEPKGAPDSPLKEVKTPREAVGWLRQILTARAARNSSLIMMLAITAFLYYFSYSQLPSNTSPVFDAEKVAALHRTGAQSPAWNLWQTLNPNDDALVHLRIEEPALITFDTQVGMENLGPYSPSLSHLRVARYIVRITKVIIIPIGATTFSLWLLLLFLLKDARARQAELASQENKPGSDANVDLRFKFTTLPRGCEADVDQVAATPDGRTVVSVSFDNEVVVWSIATGEFFNLPVDDLDDQGSVVTTVAVDSVGHFCAAGTRAGVIALWLLKGGQPVRRQLLKFDAIRSRVLELVFEDRPATKSTTERPTMLHRRSSSGDTTTTEGFLLASYKNGSVVEWNDLYDSKPVLVYKPQPSDDYGIVSTRAILLRPGANEGVSAAILHPDGHVQIFKRTIQEWKTQQAFLPILHGPEDVVVRLHGQMISLDLTPRLIIATGARSGFIALWDGVTGEQLYALEELYEDVSRIRVAGIPARVCPTCSETTPDSFIVTISCATFAHIHAFALVDPRRCTCPMLQPSGMQTPTPARSRHGSVVGTGIGSSPVARKAKLPGMSVNGMADFPVSAHGYHSRRASDKDPGRRQASESLLNITGEEVGLKRSGSGLKLNNMPGMNGVPGRSNGARLELQQARVASVSFKQGAWDVMGHVVYGLRKSSDLETLLEDAEFSSPRGVDSNAQQGSNYASGRWTGQFEGLDLPVLNRWLLWTFDPTSLDLSIRTTSLASLCITPLSLSTLSCDGPPSRLFNRSSRAALPPLPLAPIDNLWSFKKQSAFPRLSFTEISSLVTVGQETCIAAFGNTVGLISFGPAPSTPATSHSHISSLSGLTSPPSINVAYKKRL